MGSKICNKQFKLSKTKTYQEDGKLKALDGKPVSIECLDDYFKPDCVIRDDGILASPCWYCHYNNDTKFDRIPSVNCIAYMHYVELLEDFARDNGFAH